LLAVILVIFLHGDRELDALDFVLSEFHLGATYEAIVRRRLWRRLPFDVLAVPLVILAIAYALSLSGQTILLTSIAMYAAVWHRGRQSLGVARFYQRAMGGPVSRAHEVLFRGAIYLPMLAAMLAYTHLVPTYDGQPYLALNAGAEITATVGVAATLWVIGYVSWTFLRQRDLRPVAAAPQGVGTQIHPGECWLVLAHAMAFASGYALGATNASFLLVLAVHHEVQYLYFAYAMSGRAGKSEAVGCSATKPPAAAGREFRTEVEHAASFVVWPVIGFTGAIAGGWLELEWLAPLGVGGLFCHYWLDGRIWTRRSFQD
jgi:hypothetical protein